MVGAVPGTILGWRTAHLRPARPKFDRATQAFLKIEMRHGAHSFHSIRLATFGIFKIDMEIVKRATGAIANGTGIESM